MGCVFREYDHDCADDCPFCCGAPGIRVSEYNDVVKPARDEEALHLLRTDPAEYFRRLAEAEGRSGNSPVPQPPESGNKRNTLRDTIDRWFPPAFRWGFMHPFGPPPPWWSQSRRDAYFAEHGTPWETKR